MVILIEKANAEMVIVKKERLFSKQNTYYFIGASQVILILNERVCSSL